MAKKPSSVLLVNGFFEKKNASQVQNHENRRWHVSKSVTQSNFSVAIFSDIISFWLKLLGPTDVSLCHFSLDAPGTINRVQTSVTTSYIMQPYDVYFSHNYSRSTMLKQGDQNTCRTQESTNSTYGLHCRVYSNRLMFTQMIVSGCWGNWSF